MNEENKIIAWNTGRLYTEVGQRIAAVAVEDGHVMFYDIDRNICGLTKTPCALTRTEVMDFYDHHVYDNSGYSRELAVLRKSLLEAALNVPSVKRTEPRYY